MSEEKRDLTTLEILSIAIRSEIDAVKLYARMKEISGNADLAEKFDFLISQEEKHKRILTEVYEKKFPGVDLKLPPKAIVPIIDEALARNADLKELFEVGMKAEKLAENFYMDLAVKTSDSNAKSMLMYMASMERSHYAILEAEYKQFELGQFADTADILDSDRLMSLGP